MWTLSPEPHRLAIIKSFADFQLGSAVFLGRADFSIIQIVCSKKPRAHTIRIARLKMLYVAAKIRFHGNRDEVLFSIHKGRASGIMEFLRYLNKRRKELAPERREAA